MKRIGCLLLGLGLAASAQAGIYKHVDAEGHVTYTNEPVQGGVMLDIQPPPPARPASEGAVPAASSPDALRRLEQEKQKQQIAQRRAVLEEELALERQALEDARARYTEAEKDPEVFSHVVGEDAKPILGAKEGRAARDAGGKPVVVDSSGNPVLGSDNKPVPPRLDKSGNPLPYILGANGRPVLGKDGKPALFQKKRGRNMAWYAEKLNQLQEEIQLHEQKIEALELELSKL